MRDKRDHRIKDQQAPSFFADLSIFLFLFVMRFHKVNRENGIDDISHKKGGEQGNNECNWKEEHEFTNDPAPECKRYKRSKCGHGSGKYRKENFSCSHFSRRFNIAFTVAE